VKGSATKKVAYNTLVQIGGKVVVLVVGALSIGILTRYLGPTGYGKFTLALVYLSFFGIVADLGLFTIAVREMSKNPRRIAEIAGNTLSLRTLLAAVVMSLAVGISWLLPYEPDVKIAIAIATVPNFLGLMNSTLVTVFQTKLRMERSVIADIVGRLASLAAVIVVAVLDLGFYAVVTTAAVGMIVTFASSALLARRLVRLRFLTDVALWKELLVESLPLGAALVIVNMYFRADIILLSFLRSNAEVGLYGAVFKLIELLITLPVFFMNSVLPVLMRRLGEGKDQAARVIQKSFDLLLIAGLAFAGGGLVLAPDIMRLIGGSEFVPAADALRLSLAAVALTFLSVAFSNLYIAKGRQVMALKLGTIGLIINVGLNLLVIPAYGITGAAAVTLFSELVIFVLYLRGASRDLGFGVSPRVIPRLALATAAMIAVTWLLRGSFPLALLGGGLTYLAGLVGLGIITKDVIRELRPGS
jgi:O-antigen/teichoic acid export membrane protein